MEVTAALVRAIDGEGDQLTPGAGAEFIRQSQNQNGIVSMLTGNQGGSVRTTACLHSCVSLCTECALILVPEFKRPREVQEKRKQIRGPVWRGTQRGLMFARGGLVSFYILSFY